MAKPSTTENPPVIIPWSYLSQTSKPTPPPKPSPPSPPTQQKTFDQALSNVCDIPLSQLPKACVKGDRIAISIPEEEFLAGFDACKHNLHGRIILPKGSSPLTIDSLKSKLSALWKSIGKWGLISLGKGFYEFVFSSLEDMRSVRSVGAWNLSPGLLKLFAWTSDFNPGMQPQTTAQVWVRIFGLSQEYWRPKILFAIASSLGIPICTDSFTNKPMLERTFGHYARVLVDVNLAQELRYRILVERKGFAFFVDVEYENLPDFCDSCKFVGHNIENCKRRKDGIIKEATKKPVAVKQFVPVQNKGKVDEVINVEGSASKEYNQVRHDQERLEADKLLEIELNKNLGDTEACSNSPHNSENVEDVVPVHIITPVVDTQDNSSSIGSDFVDNTQIGQDPKNISSKSDGAEQIPLLVQNDIQFLKESWANLADIEDQNAIPPLAPIQHLDKPPDKAQNTVDANKQADMASPSNQDNEGFKLVIGRSSKRIDKAKASAQKNVHITKSKVGSPKPSK
jgi:hypothetical protein